MVTNNRQYFDLDNKVNIHSWKPYVILYTVRKNTRDAILIVYNLAHFQNSFTQQ